MARRLLCLTLALLVALSVAIPPPSAIACGPFFTVTTFVHRLHPDFPLSRYVTGELGILQPTYARSYLVVAYRYLNGWSLSRPEQASVLALWNRRVRYSLSAADSEQEPSARWVLARRKFTGGHDSAQIDRYSKQWAYPGAKAWEFFSYENCLADAFTTAAATLEERAKQFGPDSEAVRSWIQGQDLVFSNCGTPVENDFPHSFEALPPSAPALLQADRRYQTASLHFYSKDFTRAETEFAAIAKEADSPWHEIASLLMARCRIRQATVADENQKDRDNDLQAADDQLKQVLARSSKPSIRASAARLHAFIQYRLHPWERFAELAAQLSAKGEVADLGDAIGDFTLLLDANLGDSPESSSEDRARVFATAFRTSQAQRRQDDLVDWLVTFQSADPSAPKHALDRWRATRSPAWLVAALSLAHGYSREHEALLNSTNKPDARTPGFATITFHRNRLLAETGREEEARVALNALLGDHRGQLPRSAVNLFLALRAKLARNLDEWLVYAPRVPALVGIDENDDESAFSPYTGAPSEYQAVWKDRLSGRPRFDADAAIVLSQNLPLASLMEAARKSLLPDPLRANVVQAAWVRAVLLNRHDVALNLLPEMEQFFPKRASDLHAYRAAASPEESRFAASLAILKSPGWHPYVEVGTGRETPGYTQIDSYKDNWWCADRAPASPDWTYLNYYKMWAKISDPLAVLYPKRSVELPEFLDAKSRQQVMEERNALAATGDAVEALAVPVMAWSHSHPTDPRVPEALHYVVRSYRYGCVEDTKVNYSKLAFKLLHKQYPNNPWTRKTPYWF